MKDIRYYFWKFWVKQNETYIKESFDDITYDQLKEAEKSLERKKRNMMKYDN